MPTEAQFSMRPEAKPAMVQLGAESSKRVGAKMGSFGKFAFHPRKPENQREVLLFVFIRGQLVGGQNGFVWQDASVFVSWGWTSKMGSFGNSCFYACNGI